MVPSLRIAAEELPERVKLAPDRKLLFGIFNVEAKKPFLSICPCAPTRMPLGLITKTRPFACNDPYISEGLPEKTRFKATALADGWTNFVTSPRPIEKSCQLIMTRLAL